MLKGIAKKYAEKTKEQKICEHCGKSYYVVTQEGTRNSDSVMWKKRRFCSAYNRAKHDTRKVKVCPICKKEFKRSRSGTTGRGICCSIKCASQLKTGKNNPRWSGGKYEHVCKKCGKKFNSYKKTQVYCSYKCRGNTNVAKRGYRAELRAIRLLKKEGFSTVRSAGSKGVFDLIAYNNNKIKFIQVKKVKDVYFDEGKVLQRFGIDVEKMVDERVPSFAVKELWVYTDKRKGPHIELISV